MGDLHADAMTERACTHIAHALFPASHSPLSLLFLSHIYIYAVDLILSDPGDVDLKELTITLVSTVLSGCVSFVALFITSINIWFNSKGCFTGPTAMYILNFGASTRSDLHILTARETYVAKSPVSPYICRPVRGLGVGCIFESLHMERRIERHCAAQILWRVV